MAFTIIERGSVSGAPVQYARNTLVFSGAVIGFVIAVWLFALGVPEIWFAKGKRGEGV